MEENKNIQTYELYVDNFQSKMYPIHWMEIKEKDKDEFLLIIPYSPLIHIQSFINAIYKQYMSRPGSQVDSILHSIKTLYKHSSIFFSKTFLKKIKALDDKTTIKLNINYNINDEAFTYSHLYFLNLFLTKFNLIQVDNNTMDILIDNKSFQEEINDESSYKIRKNNSDKQLWKTYQSI